METRRSKPSPPPSKGSAKAKPKSPPKVPPAAKKDPASAPPPPGAPRKDAPKAPAGRSESDQPPSTIPVKSFYRPVPAVDDAKPLADSFLGVLRRACDDEIRSVRLSRLSGVPRAAIAAHSRPWAPPPAAQTRPSWEFYQERLLASKEPRERKKGKLPNFMPGDFHYEKWGTIGPSYLVDPAPERLSAVADPVDFICNSRYRALASGGEGKIFKAERDDHTPIAFATARLNMTMKVEDEVGMDCLRVEEQEKKLAAGVWVAEEVAELAKQRWRINRKLAAIMGERTFRYRPDFVLPVDDFSGVEFPRCRLSELHFLTYIIFLVEAHSELTPPTDRRYNITRLLYRFLPLLLEAQQHPECDFHFAAPSLHLAFIFRWLNLLNRLDDYFRAAKYIPLRATFGLVGGLRADQSVSSVRLLTPLFDGIRDGAGLSAAFCDLRNIAIAMRANHAGGLARHAMTLLRRQPPPPRQVLLEGLCRNFPGQPPHLVKFVFEGGLFTATASTPDVAITTTPLVFPQYSTLSFQPKGNAAEVGEIFHAGNLTFTVGVRDFDSGSGSQTFGINFMAGTYSSVISLDEDAI
jgi:hypothetical protein